MKRLLTLALFALLTAQGFTDKDTPEPEQPKPRKEVYDRRELPKVRMVGRN